MRPQHDQQTYDDIAKDMNFVKDHSGLKPPQIYRRIGIPSSQFTNITKHASCGLVPQKRAILTEMVNETRSKRGDQPFPVERRLDLDQGIPIEITSRELDIRVLQEVVREREKLWIVQISLNERSVK